MRILAIPNCCSLALRGTDGTAHFTSGRALWHHHLCRDLATPSKPVIAAIGDANGIVAQKQLHAFDPDFYLTLRARATGAATLRISDGYGVAITEVLGGGPPPPTNLQLKV